MYLENSKLAVKIIPFTGTNVRIWTNKDHPEKEQWVERELK